MRHEVTIARLVEQLEHFRQRPAMYIRPIDVSHVEAFLAGFDVALHECGIALDHVAIWKERGWDEHPLTIAHRMQARGDDPNRIVNELIDLMINALKRWPLPLS